MQYRLTMLEGLLHTIVPGLRQAGLQPSEKEIYDCRQLLDKLAEGIRYHIILDITRSHGNSPESYVRGHQQAIVHCCRMIPPDAPEQQAAIGISLDGLTSKAGAVLLELLDLLENLGAHMLDQDLALPDIYSTWLSARITNELPFIRERLEYHQTDAALVEIALQPFGEFTAGSVSRDFGRALFLKGLLKMFRQMEFPAILPANAVLAASLARMNYNSAPFAAYCTRFVKATLLPNMKNRAGALYRAVKILTSKNACPWNRANPSLQDQLLLWLEMETGHRLPTPGLPVSHTIESFPMLKFNIPLKSLALIWRACFDTRLLLNSNKAGTYRQLAPFVSTISQEGISAKSLLKKASKPQDRYKELAKDVLMKLFREINRY